MTVSSESLFWLTVVGALWGGTNPLLKKGASTSSIKKIHGSNVVTRFLNEVFALITNWKYMIPFLLNQSGSVVYFFSLQDTEMSLAVPISNSLTFVFTAICGWILGEGYPNARKFVFGILTGMMAGMLLVLSGISLCVLDKSFDY